MDSFEINKIVAAVLLVALLLIGIGKLSNIIFYVKKPETPGYTVEVAQNTSNNVETSSEITDEKIDIAAFMAMGDICLLYTSPSPRDKRQSRMPSSA